MDFTPRDHYVSRITPFINKNLIKVIVGQRRVGKSYMLLQIIKEIKKINKNANIIFVNKELHEFDIISTNTELIKYIEEKTDKKKKNYVLIDEVQDIQHFEKALRSLLVSDKYDLYITGSNAYLLSGELSTYLSGRYIEIKIFGLYYNEFLLFHKLKDTEESFMLYIKYGGLPYLYNLELREEVVFDYLKNIYAAILFKDVVSRHEIRNVALLESLVKFLADNVGNLLSAKSISDFLKSQRIAISPSVLLNYLKWLQEAFFVFKAYRSEIAGKKILEIGQKYYFEDLGLRHSLIGYRTTDIGKMLENVVYLHMKTAGYEVFVGKNKEMEIDFVCEKNNERLYIQVAYLIINEKTKEREFGNLLKIQDQHPKYVLSMDRHVSGNYKGIKHMNVRTFLSELIK